MTQLFINGRELDLPTDISLTLTEENPYFTTAGQFSDEIEIPLVGKNATILGMINRRDVTYRRKSWDARLVVDNRTIVEGTATVTGMTDISISIQILGDNSNVNYLTKFNDVYIDEMNLGYACAGLQCTYSQTRGGVTTDYIYSWDKDKLTITSQSSSQVMTGDHVSTFERVAMGLSSSDITLNLLADSSTENFVCLPALTSNGMQIPVPNRAGNIFFESVTGKTVNNFCHTIDRTFNWMTEGQKKYSPSTLAEEDFPTGSGSQWTESALTDYVEGEQNYILPQPYLSYVIERFVNELGYTISDSDLRSDWLKNAYIVNVTYTLLIQNMLPHWTATQFMTEIEHTLGVVFWFNSKTKICTIKKRTNAFKSVKRVNDIDDSYTAEVNDDDTTDISNANVIISYDDKLHHFDDTIRDNAHEVECDGIAGVESLLSQPEAPDGTPIEACIALRRSSSNTNATCRKYIKYNDTVTACDQMSDLIRGEDNEEIELGIVPAMVKAHELYTFYPRAYNKGNLYLIYKTDNPILQRCPVGESVPLRKSDIDIGGYIDGTDSVEENSVNKIHIALFDAEFGNGTYPGDGDNLQSLQVTDVFGWVWEQDDLTNCSFMNHSDTLQLTGDPSLNTLSKNWNTVNIDTTVAYSITMYTDKRLDLRNIFVFDGHKYAAKSAKYNIDTKGINKSVELVMYKFIE